MTDLPTLHLENGWGELKGKRAAGELERMVARWIRERRWFGYKAATITAVRIESSVEFPGRSGAAVVLLRVGLADGRAPRYFLPLTILPDQDNCLPAHQPHLVLGRARGKRPGWVCDAFGDSAFAEDLLNGVAQDARVPLGKGLLAAQPFSAFTSAFADGTDLVPRLSLTDQTNTAILYGSRIFAKVFRRLEAGVNPDLEIGHYLTEVRCFPHVPPMLAAWQYQEFEREPTTLAIFQAQVPNQGDAWTKALSLLRADKSADHLPGQAGAGSATVSAVGFAALLGRRTAELHEALAQPSTDAHFQPEPFTAADLRALADAVAASLDRALAALRQQWDGLPAPIRTLAGQLLALEAGLRERIRFLRERELEGLRIRVHGDYHLGQLLLTGDDFMIIDFEGEPTRSIEERRRKHSPLKDVAGMLRSFHYAVQTATKEDPVGRTGAWAAGWLQRLGDAFLGSYWSHVKPAALFPKTAEMRKALLNLYLLEKAVYELDYELNHRPDWVDIPLQGLAGLGGIAPP